LVECPDIDLCYAIVTALALHSFCTWLPHNRTLYCWRWVSSTVFDCDSSLFYV